LSIAIASFEICEVTSLRLAQDKHDRSVQEAAENASAGKLLLDACKGYVAEHRGVGMVVIAILRQANITSLFGLHGVETDIVINELLPGGPAANCGQIQIGDILIAVDGKKVQGVTVEEVKKLVLGPEGTTASLTLIRPSLTGGARYTLNLVRGDSAKNRSYADEAKEAIDTLSHVYEESRSLVKKNEEVLAMLAEGMCVCVCV
jgi:C-terminal processing protease CtpA/Prc